jgi:hypothetical protein
MTYLTAVLLNKAQEHLDMFICHRGASRFGERKMFAVEEIGDCKVREEPARMHIILRRNH